MGICNSRMGIASARLRGFGCGIACGEIVPVPPAS
jgi:hypothetical protein